MEKDVTSQSDNLDQENNKENVVYDKNNDVKISVPKNKGGSLKMFKKVFKAPTFI